MVDMFWARQRRGQRTDQTIGIQDLSQVNPPLYMYTPNLFIFRNDWWIPIRSKLEKYNNPPYRCTMPTIAWPTDRFESKFKVCLIPREARSSGWACKVYNFVRQRAQVGSNLVWSLRPYFFLLIINNISYFIFRPYFSLLIINKEIIIISLFVVEMTSYS